MSLLLDALKKAAFELSYVTPPADASERELANFAKRNETFFSVPDTAAAVGQVFVGLLLTPSASD